ncbi:Phosphoglycolate phosphatase 1A, chloroplastic [Asimina triloba]
MAMNVRPLGKRLVFVTNNSTKSRKQYGKKFESLGLNVNEVYVVGEDGILKELELAGFQYLGGPEDGNKKIELKPGFLMEHDKNVCFRPFLASMFFIAPSIFLYLFAA